MPQEILTQEDFAGGVNQDVAPHLIDEDASFDFLNFVLDDDGSAYRRGGTSAITTNGMDNEGRFLWDGIVVAGQRTLTADEGKTYAIDSDGITLVVVDPAIGMPYPKQTAVMAGLLFIGGGAIWAGSRSSTSHSVSSQLNVTQGSETVTQSSGDWTGIVEPGHLMYLPGERVYAVESVQSGTSLTISDPYKGTTASNVSATFDPIYRNKSNDPYPPGDYLTVCQNRLCWGDEDTVRFSDIGDPHTYSSTDYHTLPTGAEISGLSEVGGTLLSFTTHGIWTIDGMGYDIVDAVGNGQHRIKRLSEAIIMAGSPGIAGHDQQIVVPASDGIYLIDGVSAPVRISRGIERQYRGWIEWGAGFGQAAIYKGHYLLPIVAPTGAVKSLFICRLDRPVKSRFDKSTWPWVRFDGDGGETPAFWIRHGVAQVTPVLIGVQGRDNAKVVDCSEFFNGDSELEVDTDGTWPIAQLTTRDYGSGEMTINAIRTARLRYELAGDDGAALKVEWSAGGPNYSIAGKAGLRWQWGRLEGAWGDAEGIWGQGFGPLNPDSLDEPGTGANFLEVEPSPGPSNGLRPEKVRINQRARYSRLRITCNGFVRHFRLRSIEILTRPSQAVRR